MTRVDLQRALVEVLETLATVSTTAPPEAALAAIREIGARHGVDVDLVWEQEPYSRAFHYDALLVAPGLGTVSLGLALEGSTPWPLRSAIPTRERDLLSVNGETLGFERAMAILGLWEDAALLRRIVDDGIVVQALRKRGLSGPDAYATLRDTIASRSVVEATWERDPRAFDVAHVARLRVAEEARPLVDAVAAGERGFYEAAEDAWLRGAAVRLPAGMFASLTRRGLSPATADALFGVEPVAVVGPFKTPRSYEIMRVARIEQGDLERADTLERVKGVIFDDWIAEERSRARLEWFWGTRDQTDAALRR